MKKKVYLLGIAILIISIISSFAMTAFAEQENEPSNSSNSSESVSGENNSSSEDENSSNESSSSEDENSSNESSSSEDESSSSEDESSSSQGGIQIPTITLSPEEKSELSSLYEGIKDVLSSTTTTKASKEETTKQQVPTTKKPSKTNNKKKPVATTLSEAEITTIAIEEEEIANVSSLKNTEHGVSVYPDRTGGYSFTNGSQLTVMGVDENSEGYTALVNASGISADKFIFLKDISVLGYDGQKVKIAFSVGEQYKGQVVTVLHYHNADVETIVTKVSDDGLIVIMVDGLSPFAIMLGQPEIVEEAGNIFEKIEESTGISKIGVILIIAAVVVLAAIIVVVVVINIDRKKKWVAANSEQTNGMQ